MAEKGVEEQVLAMERLRLKSLWHQVLDNWYFFTNISKKQTTSKNYKSSSDSP